MNEVRAAVAGALAAGWHLPEIEPISDEALPSTVSSADWFNLFSGISNWIGELEHYSTNQVLRGHGGGKITVGSVADDLADIWRDLHDALEADRRGTPWQDVVWEIKVGLDTHWGKHAVEVLRTLQGR